ncbi:MAG: ABC transporter substrate-binding protein [Alphaproteobacteria bacterium]|nr:ABC transporter substrate-binding protein [Alphaproteobacteria bacterium]
MKYLVLIFSFLFFTMSAHATMNDADTKKAEAFIEGLYNDINTNILNKKISRDKKYDFVHTLLVGKMDLIKISSFILGSYWKSAEEKQKNAFTSLFEEFQTQRFTNILSDYNGQEISLKGTETASGTNQIFVNMLVENKKEKDSEPILLKWRVNKSKSGEFKIVDVIIAGISMSVTLQSDYRSLIQKAEQNGHNGLDHLIGQLQEKIEQERKGAKS